MRLCLAHPFGLALSRRMGVAIIGAILLASPAKSADLESRAMGLALQDAERLASEAEAIHAERAREADAAKQSFMDLQARVRSAAADVRRHEAKIEAIAGSLTLLETQQSARQEEWQARRQQTGAALAALARVAAVPPSAALLNGEGTTERLRTSFVLRTMLPHLQARADRLRAELAKIRETEAKVAARKQELAEATKMLQQRLAVASKLATEKQAYFDIQQAAAAKAAADAARFARGVDDVRSLMAHLDDRRTTRQAAIAAERRRRAAVAARAGVALPDLSAPPLQLAGLANVKGMILPVAGQLQRSFGEGRDQFAEGISLSARPSAPVLSPADGQVQFAGPFKTYGLVLIIDHGAGFHSVLTGMDRTDTATGHWVLAGEAVGRLAPHGSLYVEIRHNGRPVDPMRWFATGRS